MKDIRFGQTKQLDKNKSDYILESNADNMIKNLKRTNCLINCQSPEIIQNKSVIISRVLAMRISNILC